MNEFAKLLQNVNVSKISWRRENVWLTEENIWW